MAKHRRRHHHGRRRNPLGFKLPGKAVLSESLYNAGGALGSLWLSNQFGSFSSGWAGVLATGGSAVAVSTVAGFIGSSRLAEEVLKGGLTATIIKALHQLGVAQSIGLGLYSPSWFATPTSSNAYMRTYPGNMNAPMALPAPAAGRLNGMGFHRFRSRYAGNY